MNRYDSRSRLVFHFAREESTRLGHTTVGPEHLLLGLLREGGRACAVLNDFGVTLDGARHRVLALTGRGKAVTADDTAEITPSARTVMELAGLEAERLGSRAIRTEHILLGLLRYGEGHAFSVLQGFTKDPEIIRHRILEAALPEPNADEDASPRLRLNPGGWDETYLGVDKLSPVMEVKLGLRLLGRGVRHLLNRV